MSETKIPTVSCTICGNSEGWINVDEYRFKPGGMSMCPKCGFVTYPEIIAKAEDLKQFYRNDYRAAPSVQNVFTGQRKLHYHASFLADLLQRWRSEKRSPVVFEVGAAFGMFLKWVKDNFSKADVSGSELTISYRRNAYHEYGIKLSEEFDDTKEYDLVASYKVAEHIPGIEKELRRYALALKPNGHLYISVPTWFHSMTNFGSDGFSLDYYYDKNHVNVWTRKLFETLLKKSGLEVVKQDHIIYDSTYLCKRNDELMKVEPQYEEPAVILDALSRIKKASMAFDDQRFEEAIELFPAYPEAHISAYEKSRNEWHKKGFAAIEKEVLGRALSACPESTKITFFCADLCIRYDQWEKAIQFIDKTLEHKSNDPGALIALGHCYRQMAERAASPAEKVKFYDEARNVTRHLNQVSMQHSHDTITWIFADNAKIPMPDEVSHGKPEPRDAAEAR